MGPRHQCALVSGENVLGEKVWLSFIGRKRLGAEEGIYRHLRYAKPKCNYVVEKMSIWEARLSSGSHLAGNSQTQQPQI